MLWLMRLLITRRQIGYIITALCSISVLYFLFNWSASVHHDDSAFDVLIVVPGGGAAPGGVLPMHTQLRADRAIELYKEYKKKRHNVGLITLSQGTTHKPNPLNEEGRQITEAAAATTYLSQRGVAIEDIFEEAWSLDTIGNAYFLRVVHTDIAQWRHLIVITNTWHMDRVKAIFNTVFGLSPLPSNKRYDIHYETVGPGIEDNTALAARVAHETKQLVTFKSITRKQIGSTLSSLHRWLFTRHDAYRANGQFTASSNGTLLATY